MRRSFRLESLVVFALAFVLVACGDSEGPAIPDAATDAPIDAPPPDAAPPDARVAALGCIGDPDPTTAVDPITLAASANTVGLGGATPVENVTIDAQLRSDPDGTPLATGVTDVNGDATLTLVTGGLPVDGLIRATPANTYLTTELFSPQALVADSPAPGILIDRGTLDLLSMFTGITQDQANGFALVAVIDCEQVPIAGAVVTAPTGTVVYAGSNGQPNTGLTETSEVGLAFVFNVEPGEGLVFDAEVLGMSLRDNTVRSVANQVVSLAITP